MSEVLYNGQSVLLTRTPDDFVELCLRRSDAAINKLDQRTLEELSAVATLLEQSSNLRGLLVSSGLEVFVVGADITEFSDLFERSEEELVSQSWRSNQLFERLAAMPFPSVVAINGFALGGGLELALAFDYRVIAETAKVGLPEVSLGLIPGLGGTVRLTRVAGVEVALNWILSGKPQSAEQAQLVGVVEHCVLPQRLRDTALELLAEAADGLRAWGARRETRLGVAPAPRDPQVFSRARSDVQVNGAKHQPARQWAVDLLEAAYPLSHSRALRLEGELFGKLAKTQAAASLVRTFLNSQLIKKISKNYSTAARPIKLAVVLGAGIMGGGIAYTSALRGTAVRMKDVRQQALDAGMAETSKLLARQVSLGRLDEKGAERIQASITPQLDYTGFGDADILIEAVVEKLSVKHAVLSEVEKEVSEHTVLLSNTSSLRIDDLATVLERPANFAGMHFFNPVPVMPLVEIIRGQRSSDAAVGAAVSQALAMGKTPIVVRDGPGFLVNRILSAYIRAFLQLVDDGADFEEVDRVAEAFGWPMGPAYLEDVVGLDTGMHVCEMIFAGYPQRMTPVPGDAIKTLLEQGRLGQKNGSGFYKYVAGPNGRLTKTSDPSSHALINARRSRPSQDFSDEVIIERLMLALVIEAIHALQDGIVDTPAELDTALLLGIGFPAYLGGPLAYADWMGAKHLLERCEHYAPLGEAYQAPTKLLELAHGGSRFYGG